MANTYMPELPNDLDRVRFLLNDVAEVWVFSDEEITMVLDLEGGFVKLAAAQMIDTNADNEALASKVLRTQDLQTDGAKLADVLHKRAAELRRQHEVDVEGEGFFDIIPGQPHCPPELAPFELL